MSDCSHVAMILIVSPMVVTTITCVVILIWGRPRD